MSNDELEKAIQLKKNIEQEIEKLKKDNEKINSEEKPKLKNIKLFYIFPILNIVLSIAIFCFLAFVVKKLFLIIIFLFLAVPLTLLSIIFLIARLIIDKKKISNKVIPIFTKNFIVARFFKENRRIEKIIRVLNPDGITFNYNKGLYCVDLECVWRDENNYPTSLYKEGIPNPIKIDFTEIFKEFNLAVSKGEKKIIYKGQSVDLVFSSLNLETFKKNKIIEDFSKDPETTKIIMFMMLLLGLSFVAIIVIVLIKGG